MTVGNYISKYMNDVWLCSDKESKMGIQHVWEILHMKVSKLTGRP